MKRVHVVVGAAVLFLGLAPVQAGPGSFFSTRGLGLRVYYPNARSLGIGGLGLALEDQTSLSALNPALLSRVSLTRLSVSFLHETAAAAAAVESGRVTDSNVAGGQFFIPLGTDLGISAGLRPYSAVDYSFSNDGETASTSYVEKLSGDGGVNSAFLSFSFGIGSRLQLGLRGNAYFGRVKQLWEVQYRSDQFVNTRDELDAYVKGYGFTFGAVVSPADAWHIGAMLSPGFDLHTETDLTSTSGAQTPTQESTYNMPVEFGVGTSFNPHDRVLAGADVLVQRWSDFSRDGLKLAGWRDALRVGGGVELTGDANLNAGFFQRLSYRLGGYYSRLGVEMPEGQQVREIFATVGLGIPFDGNRGRIDLALNVGRRGQRPDNPVEETVWRLAIGVSGGERWFTQRR